MAKRYVSLSDLADLSGDALGIQIDVIDGRASYYAEETREAYWLSRDDLRYALTCARNPDTRDDIYSHWCAGSGRRMSRRAECRRYERSRIRYAR